MTSLHAELAGNTPATSCILCAYLASLSTAEAAEWSAELALPIAEVGHIAVVTVLRRRGVTVDEASVRRHRKNHGR